MGQVGVSVDPTLEPSADASVYTETYAEICHTTKNGRSFAAGGSTGVDGGGSLSSDGTEGCKNLYAGGYLEVRYEDEGIFNSTTTIYGIGAGISTAGPYVEAYRAEEKD